MASRGALTLHESTRKDLPSSPDDPQYAPWVDCAVSAALRLVGSLSSSPDAAADSARVWTKGKLHNGAQTYSTRSVHSPPPGSGDTEGFKWHARKSIHDATIDRVSYEHFERGLLRDHSVNESKYIESCTEAKQIDVVKAGELEVWQTLYHLAFPASDRDFAFAILTVPVPPPPPSPALGPGSGSRRRAFVVISIPYAHPTAPGYTRGKYVSVEHVAERSDGKVEWTMAVSSDPGGLVPKFVSEMSMPSKVSEDVPSFVKWARSEYGESLA
ncbi:hypothetical protein JCM3774_002463 [Rhodotorula dairenensis]